MHELGIAATICRSIIARAGGARVEELVVGVGPLAGITPETLRGALEHSAEHAEISLGKFTVELSPVHARCDCGHEFDLTDLLAACPKCGGCERILSGAEDIVVKKLVLSE